LLICSVYEAFFAEIGGLILRCLEVDDIDAEVEFLIIEQEGIIDIFLNDPGIVIWEIAELLD